MKSIIAFAILLFAANSKANQTPPGTRTRPILTAPEAAGFTQASFLQNWVPATVRTTKADFIVGPGNIRTIQEAVNRAIRTNAATRQYIRITPGRHREVVIIPPTTVPLTLYGTGAPAATIITQTISAQTTGNAYRALVSSFFRPGEPAFNYFNQCANRALIGPACSGVVRVEADNVEIINLTIENLSRNPGTDQAVALQIDADRVQVRNSRILGHQDTLFVGSTITRTLRIYFEGTYVEGDTDFVFGCASVVFKRCVFRLKADRRTDTGVVFAPSTPSNRLGMLVISSTITADASFITSRKGLLARIWDDGTTRNGQVIIRETRLDAFFNALAPYGVSTTGRPFTGNIGRGRNLNNPTRFYEFRNTGLGA